MVATREKLAPAIEKAAGVKPTHTDLLIALVARVLVQHPRMNASWTGDAIRLNPDVNIGIAMAVEDGVVVAVIPKANTMDLGQIATQRRDLTERARANRLRPSDIAGATFTISNLGMYHVDAFTAIIDAAAGRDSGGRRHRRSCRRGGRATRRPAHDRGHGLVRPPRRGRRAGRGFYE